MTTRLENVGLDRSCLLKRSLQWPWNLRTETKRLMSVGCCSVISVSSLLLYDPQSKADNENVTPRCGEGKPLITK